MTDKFNDAIVEVLRQSITDPETGSILLDDDRITLCVSDVDAAIAWMEALEAENERLREIAARLDGPGDMHWCAENPENPADSWDAPVIDRWGSSPGEVFEVMAAVALPNIYVAERVISVTEDGDPDETEAVWFRTKAEAAAAYRESLEMARAALEPDAASR